MPAYDINLGAFLVDENLDTILFDENLENFHNYYDMKRNNLTTSMTGICVEQRYWVRENILPVLL